MQENEKNKLHVAGGTEPTEGINRIGESYSKLGFCKFCGKEIPDSAHFCQYCGTVKSEEGSIGETSKRKYSIKPFLWIGLGAVILIILFLVLFSSGKKKNAEVNGALYLKDRELFYSDFSKKDPWQVTSKLLNDDRLSIGSSTPIERYFLFSSDGEILFFPDKIENGNFSLYYRNMKKPDQEKNKIDSEVSIYHVDKSTSLVTYLKGTDTGVLYQYDMKKQEKSKIGMNVASFEVSDDGKKLYYLDTSGTLYFQIFGKEKETVDRSVKTLCHVEDDFSTVYYEKENAFYKKAEGKEKEKLLSDIGYVVQACDSGKAYYTRDNTEQIPLNEFIKDDLLEDDQLLTIPKFPDEPVRTDFATEEEFSAQKKLYEKQLEEYLKSLQKYSEKLLRDHLREIFLKESVHREFSSLYYFDGSKEVKIEDDYSGRPLSHQNETQFLLFKTSPPVSYNKASFASYFKLFFSKTFHVNRLGIRGENSSSYSFSGNYSSEKVVFFDISDIPDLLNDKEQELSEKYGSLDNLTFEELYSEAFKVWLENYDNKVSSDSDFYASLLKGIKSYNLYDTEEKSHIAVGASFMEIGSSANIDLSPDKKSVCYLDGEELYKMDLTGGKAMQPKQINSDVTSVIGFFENGQLAYFKDGQDLWIEQKHISSDVYRYSVTYCEALDAVVYLTDWDSKNKYGTLKIYENNTVSKIAEDVNSLTVLYNGDIVYLSDMDSEKGSLYLSRGGKKKKIDEDVEKLIPMIDGTQYRNSRFSLIIDFNEES